MNITEVHDPNETISAKNIAELTGGKVTAIQILEGGLLKEHLTRVPALLICIQGEAIYQDKKDREVVLKPGDYYLIEPMVLHWLKGGTDSQLLLVK
jgi:quercetin dioxygenase-like cupin family protein